MKDGRREGAVCPINHRRPAVSTACCAQEEAFQRRPFVIRASRWDLQVCTEVPNERPAAAAAVNYCRRPRACSLIICVCSGAALNFWRMTFIPCSRSSVILRRSGFKPAAENKSEIRRTGLTFFLCFLSSPQAPLGTPGF